MGGLGKKGGGGGGGLWLGCWLFPANVSNPARVGFYPAKENRARNSLLGYRDRKTLRKQVDLRGLKNTHTSRV